MMDIVSHALAGASTGGLFGRPVLGAIVAVMPDVVLGVKRKFTPSRIYKFTHSLVFVLMIGLTLQWFVDTDVLCTVELALLSHIVLDVPTHSTRWEPRLFYPIIDIGLGIGREWEWFNYSWFRGVLVTIIWSLSCILISY